VLNLTSDSPASREEFLNKLRRSSEVRITVLGRTTKKKFSVPVWFVLGGEKVFLVPNTGSDNNWFKDLAENPQIELSIGNASVTSKASLVRDSDEVKKVLDKFREKYRSMWSESYYTKRDVLVQVTV